MALEANQKEPIRWKERIGIMAIGHTFNSAEVVFFEWIMYPAVIAMLGMVTGGLVMTVVSVILCHLHILFYDWAKQDWLGLELLKELRDGEDGHSRIARVIQWATRSGDWLVFLVMACCTDPFITTVYMRRGASAYTGLSSRDRKIFWGSVVVSNLSWTVIVTAVVAIARSFLSWSGF